MREPKKMRKRYKMRNLLKCVIKCDSERKCDSVTNAL